MPLCCFLLLHRVQPLAAWGAPFSKQRRVAAVPASGSGWAKGNPEQRLGCAVVDLGAACVHLGRAGAWGPLWDPGDDCGSSRHSRLRGCAHRAAERLCSWSPFPTFAPGAPFPPLLLETPFPSPFWPCGTSFPGCWSPASPSSRRIPPRRCVPAPCHGAAGPAEAQGQSNSFSPGPCSKNKTAAIASRNNSLCPPLPCEESTGGREKAKKYCRGRGRFLRSEPVCFSFRGALITLGAEQGCW